MLAVWGHRVQQVIITEKATTWGGKGLALVGLSAVVRVSGFPHPVSLLGKDRSLLSLLELLHLYRKLPEQMGIPRSLALKVKYCCPHVASSVTPCQVFQPTSSCLRPASFGPSREQFQSDLLGHYR